MSPIASKKVALIQSPADTDAYKFSMAQYALHRAPTAMVEYKFVNRSPIDLRPLRDEIQEQINLLADLKYTDAEIAHLRRHPWFTEDFLLFLKLFRLDPSSVVISEIDGKLDIRVHGPWIHRIFFEIHILSIVTELHFQRTVTATDRPAAYNAGIAKLRDELKVVKQFVAKHGDAKPFRLIEMGTRRRVSREYQGMVLDVLKNEIPDQLFGTSNVLFSLEKNLRDVGTMAHEFLQVHQQIGPRLENAQKAALEGWVQEFRGYPMINRIQKLLVVEKKSPRDIFHLLYSTEENGQQLSKEKLFNAISRILSLWSRSQWKRERYAPSFHLDDENLDPRTWCRYPILSGNYTFELAELKTELFGNAKK